MVTDIVFESGYMVVHRDHGAPVRYPIASTIRAVDIPALTYTQVASLSTVANLIVVLIRTLIARDILDEDFLEDGDYNLDDIIETIGNLGGDYGEPDLTVESG